MPAPAGVPDVCVGHVVLGDLGVLVPLDVLDAHAVLACVVLTALAVGDVLVLAVLEVLRVLCPL